MSSERYNPVPLDIEATHARLLKRPGYAAAYDALEDEFATLAVLVRARQQAKMTQADVAERLGVSQAMIGRLEASAGSRKHAPSLATLRRYADVLGCKLKIILEPKTSRRKNQRRTTTT
jgi:DNA-binding XRE family transcriptional regulator